MKLGELLGPLGKQKIVDLAHRIVPGAEEVQQHMLSRSVESVLRGGGQVEQTIQSRRPPVMALLRELLEAPGYRAIQADVEKRATTAGKVWMEKVAAGDLVGRDDSCRIYRRLLAAAWKNNLKLDQSETALLGFLRQELRMTAAEHFLVAYHSSVQPFWRAPKSFTVVLDALETHGIVYKLGEDIVLPEEFVPRVRRTIGIYMNRRAERRLLGHLSNADLKSALESHQLRAAGPKETRGERLIEHLTPVPGILEVVHIRDLRTIARKTGAKVSGPKEDVIARLIEHFESGSDLEVGATDEVAVAEVEPKATGRKSFGSLFEPLTGRRLASICDRRGLKISGSKEVQLQTLWDSPLSEHSLLRGLKNPEIRDLCRKHDLDHRGSKDEMINRLVSHHSNKRHGLVGAEREDV
jgi:hypothetical protein